MGVFEVIGRAVATFLVLLLLTRLMGRKQISQLTFFNYVTGISIGAVAGTVSLDHSIKLFTGIISLTTWCALTLIFGFIDIKSKRFRDLIDGTPVIVIKQGKIMEHELKKLRLDMEQLNQLLRNKEVFSVKDVEYAIMETNGDLSILLKETRQPVKKEDLSIQVTTPKPFPIPIPIISDGKVLEDNLHQLNLTKDWLDDQLMQSGTTLSEVFYVELQKDGSLYIDKRNDHNIH
ncbi:DUF421 domain-containing protein [Bacillus sp. ISL-7]|uniref:DUF421 domain-containing protein n=1 Tax=Bacillus sp. ISL-7 TaxID=2819136 RepID=UPI001BE8920B|nr:DUF421 domain-containing protein [Bacillus sp. ISL-7]MBT2738363.1 DUF421 domain-containing protein [Bacillus sp. ISL-7]